MVIMHVFLRIGMWDVGLHLPTEPIYGMHVGWSSHHSGLQVLTKANMLPHGGTGSQPSEAKRREGKGLASAEFLINASWDVIGWDRDCFIGRSCSCFHTGQSSSAPERVRRLTG